jgi:hypothetical protein
LAIVAIALVASMVIAVFVTAMLTVAQFTAMCGRKMSRFPFLWLLLVLGNLLENASRLVGCLTLLKKAIILSGLVGTILFKSAKLFWCALVRKEDLLTLLLRRGYIHCSTEIAALEVAEINAA